MTTTTAKKTRASGMSSENNIRQLKRGLWHNIRAKRERGEKPAKPGDKDYPDQKQWSKLSGKRG